MTDIEKHDAAKTADECEATRDKKEKHTPEPWEANEWATGWTVSAPREGYSVCHLEDCHNATANAALIAAAPELLFVLRHTLAAFDADGWTGPKHLQVHRGEAVKMMRAAIAKATG